MRDAAGERPDGLHLLFASAPHLHLLGHVASEVERGGTAFPQETHRVHLHPPHLSRFHKPLLESHNAVWVISDEDIRRAGVRSIPEALALAPGVYVAQSAGNNWTVTIGGFSLGSFSNKLLVLVDNVTVYSTLFGNVEWDLLPVTLAEVDRIEVIRGAAGVQYGANAVNGVISIFTKAPGPVAGGYARIEGGSQGVRSFSRESRAQALKGAFAPASPAATTRTTASASTAATRSTTFSD